MAKFTMGSVVHLISDSSVEGAVIDISETAKETSYTVYIGGAKGIQFYYESQLEKSITNQSIEKSD